LLDEVKKGAIRGAQPNKLSCRNKPALNLTRRPALSRRRRLSSPAKRDRQAKLAAGRRVKFSTGAGEVTAAGGEKAELFRLSAF
jgi:hypothetical protein